MGWFDAWFNFVFGCIAWFAVAGSGLYLYVGLGVTVTTEDSESCVLNVL